MKNLKQEKGALRDMTGTMKRREERRETERQEMRSDMRGGIVLSVVSQYESTLDEQVRTESVVRQPRAAAAPSRKRCHHRAMAMCDLPEAGWRPSCKGN